MEDLNFSKDKYVFASLPMLLIGDSVEANRNRQIALFLKELSTYNVLLKDLVSFPIKEGDRNIALNIAYYITNNEELLRIINNKLDLPISRISKLTRLKPNYIEKCRDYIIAYYVILSNPNYKCIQDSLKIILREDNKVRNTLNKKHEAHKGLTIKPSKKFAIILTSRGEFLKIRTEDTVSIGEICEGKEKKPFIVNFKIHISILLVILILIGSSIIIEYRRTQSIIVIETTSVIKIHTNKYNRVIYAYSPTEKGEELVNNTSILNKDVDEAIADIFEYAVNNEMIDSSRKTVITINGQAIKYGTLTRTDKVISENKIPIAINNAGNEQNLPKYVPEDEKGTEK